MLKSDNILACKELTCAKCKYLVQTDFVYSIPGGLCYQGFVEAFIQLAEKKFRSNNNFDAFQALLEHCEANLGETLKEKKQPRIISGRGQLFPSINKSESWQDDKLAAYKRQTRKKHSTAQSYFLDYRNFSEDSARNPQSVPKPTLIRTRTNIVRTGPGRFKKVHVEPLERKPERAQTSE